MKILIVEDELSQQRLLEMLLVDYGSCDLAANGREALEAIQRAFDTQEPYDLVCMDIMMPEMDGQEALQKIRQIEIKHYREGLPGIKIIMITAQKMATNMLSAFRAGCDAYITKPITRKKLIQQIYQLGLLDTPSPTE